MSKEQLALPATTAVERIYAASIEEADGSGPGLSGLSPADRLINQQLEAAYSLLLSYKTFEQCWPLLAKQFRNAQGQPLSRATCYRRLAAAMNLMGDLQKVKKQGARAMLITHTQMLQQLCLQQTPPDVRGALAAGKFLATLQGLNRPDTAEDHNAGGTGATSYVINISYNGARGPKNRQLDITRLDDISDVDYELLQGAVASNVLGVEQMEKLMAEARGEEALEDEHD